eukprot:CAMPEP_0173460700 /NCGR_PEP_ID=MMETSP1357-20121228/63603_1 /TAXON_ID=77926 /ORGANISM="Hemiselmis rufescens, Strain PCC563" /LENGTH=33 /DNA_ID= /DNA_START= /DNA_END= /DNA_ORIENTATION=
MTDRPQSLYDPAGPELCGETNSQVRGSSSYSAP